MIFSELQDDRAVLPLLLYIQERIGLWGDSPRVRYPVAFVAFWITVAVPKLSLHYTSLETFICSMAELVYMCNVWCGAMLIWMEHECFQQYIDQVTSLTRYLYRPHQLESAKEHLQQLNRYIHRYTNRYCAFMLSLIIFYVVAPIITSFVTYLGHSNQHGNETTPAWNESSAVFKFTLHMEQAFYGLQHRTDVLQYALYLTFIVPIMFITACTVHTKVITIASSVRYGEALLHVVMLKIDHLHRLPGESARAELGDIVHVHQRALECIALLMNVLRSVLLLQLVFCIFIWCLMMLYFTITDGLSVTFINIAILFLVITIETFSPCYFGTRLSSQATELSKSVYACGWPGMDGDIQHGLRMVLHRTQWAVGMQAGKFCFVDVELFQKMVNMSYSFFIVLKDAF
uniref:Uncharacterized protein n=1 Tax=Anopheles epiroticus TaxID=199890 RepID=A0A182PZ82_9DIPT